MLPLITDPKVSDLLNLSLRLLLNLSFDGGLRQIMTDSHLVAPVAKLASANQDSPQRQVSRCLLYQLSRDEKARSLLAYTEAFPLLVSQALNCPQKIPLELSALLINTALSRANAHLLTKHNKGKTLRSLVKRALKSRDALLMKAVRNVAYHEGPSKEALLPFIGKLAENVTAQDEAFAVECIGTLANLNLPTIDYSLVLAEYDLLKWLKSTLAPDSPAKDDIVLESVLLAGTAAMDEQCAKILAKEDFVSRLVNLLKSKQEDDELVCQIVYVFYQMVFHQVTRDIFLQSSAPAYLVDLMHDSNAEVRKVCDTTLDIISEFDDEWADKIRMEKFRWHNSQWLDMIEGRSHELNYDEPEYVPEDNLLLYGTEPEYFLQDNEIPPEFRPDSRSGFYDSQGPGFYEQSYDESHFDHSYHPSAQQYY